MVRRDTSKDGWYRGYWTGEPWLVKGMKGKTRFEFLKVWARRFKKEKAKGETFTQYMQRIGIWK